MNAHKYPRTPYWPTSPSIAAGDKTVKDTSAFVGKEVVVTEKLDGGNTCLHQGMTFARSTSEPTQSKWFAMVKKHHAWKILHPIMCLYGEDIYGVHSIEYDPVKEDETFYAFALRLGDIFAGFGMLEACCLTYDIPLIEPVYRGVFDSEKEINEFFAQEMTRPSFLGGEREGLVMRIEEGFHVSDFATSVCKSVRTNHVQTDEHWTRNWKPCKIKERKNKP